MSLKRKRQVIDHVRSTVRVARFAKGVNRVYKEGRKMAQRMRKRARTSAPTKTKSKKEKIIRSPSFGVSNSFAYLKAVPSPKNKTWKLIADVSISESNSQYSFLGTDGIQVVNSLQQNFTKAQLNTMWTNYVNANPGAGAKIATTNFYSARFYIHSIRQTYLITNNGPSDAILWLYDCKRRNNDLGQITPSDSWQSGYTNTAGGGQASSGQPFTVPYYSTNFTRVWNVIKCLRIELAPGRTHQHVFYHKLGRKWDGEAITDFNTFSDTTQTMLVQMGVPGSLTAGFAAGNPTLCATKVNVIGATSIRWSPISSLPKTITTVQSLPITGTTSIIDEMTDQVLSMVGAAFG